MMEYGYARVSTREQNVERQLLALREFGLTERQIVVDRQSGKDFARPGYCRLLRRLKQGDTSRASTGLGGIMGRSWSSGAASPEKRGRRSLCWICRCWTRAKAGTLPGR